MGVKGYVFIRLSDGVNPQDCLDVRQRLESIQEVVHVDGLIDMDDFDMLALVDAPITVSDVARRIEKLPGIAKVKPVRIIPESQ